MRGRGAPHASRAAPPRAVPESVGGYRVVRALGAGNRGAAYLAHNPDATPPTVAAKIAFAADAAPEADEVDALAVTASPHVVRLIDVWAAGGGTALLLEALTGGDLPALLRRARPLAPGEAVTVLVSVLRGVVALHDAGFAHGALVPANVLFDESGRPVLASLGRASRFDGPLAEAAGDDWGRFASLAATVIEHTQAFGRGREAAAVVDAAATLKSGDGTLAARVERFEQAAFDMAPAAPVRLDADAAHGAPVDSASRRTEAPPRPGRPRGPASVPAPTPRRPGGRPRLASLAAATAELMEHGMRPIIRDKVLTRLRAHRRGVVVGVALCTGMLATGLLLMPTAGSDRDTGAGHAAPAPPRVPQSIPTTAPAAPITGAAGSDDPVAAVAWLLSRRDACLERGGGECLLACDQAGSALLEDDTHAPGSSGRYGGHEPSLIERTGDAALVALTPPAGSGSRSGAGPAASVLAVKGADGWRLRELYEG